jgi:alpha-beta hydrolase superfamily lysophospholipase
MALLDRMLFEPNAKIYSKESDYAPVPVSLFMESDDGTRLHTWVFQCEHQKRRGVVLQVHGNAENLTSHAPYVAWLTRCHFDVVSWDYRGFGQSSGTASKQGAVADTRVMLKEAVRMAEGLPVVVVGQSLGAALALHALLGVELPTGSRVVLEGAFASFRGLVEIKIRQKYTPVLAGLTPLFFSSSFDAIDAIRHLQYPLLCLHSEDDEMIPFEEHRRLFEACPRSDKEFWRIKGQKHLDAFRNDESPYRRKLVQYFEGFDNASR